LDYIPGECNIGREEIARRYRIGYFGVILAVIVILIIGVAGLPRDARFLLVFPVALALTGFLQATSKFCLAYGLKGVFSTKGLRQISRVTESDARRADRRTALSMIAIVGGGSIAITLIYYFIC